MRRLVYLLFLSMFLIGCGPLEEVAKKVFPSLFSVETKPALEYDPHLQLQGIGAGPTPGAYVINHRPGPLAINLDVPLPTSFKPLDIEQFFEENELLIFDNLGTYYGDILSKELSHLLHYRIENDRILLSLTTPNANFMLPGPNNRLFYIHTKCNNEQFSFALRTDPELQ